MPATLVQDGELQSYDDRSKGGCFLAQWTKWVFAFADVIKEVTRICRCSSTSSYILTSEH